MLRLDSQSRRNIWQSGQLCGESMVDVPMHLKRRLVLLVLFLLVAPASAQSPDDAAERAALLAAYPGLFTFEGNDLVWTDGTSMTWDDGKSRSAEELIADPDIEDSFHYLYPLAAAGDLTPAPDFDPGRIRNEPFFKKLYGASAKAVEAQVKTLKWVPGFGKDHMQVTSVLDIDKRVAEISTELEALGPAYKKYLIKPGGGFVWRVIAGTTQLSVHSFGAAVDISTDFSDYWRWTKAVNGGPIPFKNRIPLEIVKIFEQHGFIWGGRWYHYDTMHFEYRPELLIFAQAM
jgi:peptidoglycan LD-endopeptidase CwlK